MGEGFEPSLEFYTLNRFSNPSIAVSGTVGWYRFVRVLQPAHRFVRKTPFRRCIHERNRPSMFRLFQMTLPPDEYPRAR